MGEGTRVALVVPCTENEGSRGCSSLAGMVGFHVSPAGRTGGLMAQMSALSLCGARLGKNQALLLSCIWACHLTLYLTFVIYKREVNPSAQRWQSIRAMNKAPESSARTRSLALPLSGPGVLGRFLNDPVPQYFRQPFWGQ